MTSQEILRQAFPDKATPLISYGLPFTEACVQHVNETFKASRVYLIASASVTKDTAHTFDLQKALASQLVKTRVGMTPHTLISEVLEIIQECRDMEIDCIVTLGGGSLIDGAKIASFVHPLPRSHPPFLFNPTNNLGSSKQRQNRSRPNEITPSRSPYRKPPRPPLKNPNNLHPNNSLWRRVQHHLRRNQQSHARESTVQFPFSLSFSRYPLGSTRLFYTA